MCRFFILRHWRRIIYSYSRKQEGRVAFGARIQAAMGLTPLAAPVPPTKRAGSEGREKVLKIDGAFAPRVLKFDSGCTAEGYGGGWRRKYIRCLSAAVVDAFKNERRHDDKTGEPPCGRSSVVWFSIPRSGIIKLIAPKGETTHYDWCVALLLPIMFAVHPKGDTTTLRSAGLSNFGPFGPVNPHADRRVKRRYHHPRPKGPSPPPFYTTRRRRRP